MLAMAIPQQALTSVQKETAASAGDSSKQDRKSTRLNSSHGYISYAVFCLKKKHSHRTSPTIQPFSQKGTSPPCSAQPAAPSNPLPRHFRECCTPRTLLRCDP